jgi:2-amino-4-hydroxy-6-hydroxymethyldihydropteridine diphosphokinase
VADLILHIGSNIGQKEENLNRCLSLLQLHVGQIIKTSGIYATEAWGVKDQAEFFNQCIQLATLLSPYDVLHTIQKIECIIGKEKQFHWGPRKIDIDIIYYDDLILNEKYLTIPHAQISHRNFVLAPLADLAPHKLHPVLGKTSDQLLTQCQDQSYAVLINQDEKV